MEQTKYHKLLQQSYRGSAKVLLSSLFFTNRHDARSTDTQNIRKLVQTFATHGCNRSEPENHIPVLLSRSQLSHVRQTSGFQESHSSIAFDHSQSIISFDTQSVHALQGRLRVLAAKQYLPPADCWWIVDCYDEGKYSTDQTTTSSLLTAADLSNELQRILREREPISKTPTDGEIFRNIRLYHRSDNVNAERQWWNKLTPTKRSDLKQLLSDDLYRQAFDRLLPYPGLWPSIRLGFCHRLFSLRCNEVSMSYSGDLILEAYALQELLNYLDQVAREWELITDNGTLASLVDDISVSELECRAPRVSPTDKTFICEGMKTMRLFPDLLDGSLRDLLQLKLLEVNGLVPSLFTFFENLKFLEPAAKIMQQLFEINTAKSNGAFDPVDSNRTILQAAMRSFTGTTGEYDILVSNSRFKQATGTLSEAFDCSYRQLWLFALANFTELSSYTPKKELRKAKPSSGPVSDIWWHELSKLAHRLKFRGKFITSWLDKDPDVELAKSFLLKNRPSALYNGMQQDEIEKYSQAVAFIMKQVKRRDHSLAFNDGSSSKLPDEALVRRMGRPFEDVNASARPFIYEPVIHGTLLQGGTHVSPLYIYHCIIRSFFLRSDHYAETELQETGQSQSTTTPVGWATLSSEPNQNDEILPRSTVNDLQSANRLQIGTSLGFPTHTDSYNRKYMVHIWDKGFTKAAGIDRESELQALVSSHCKKGFSFADNDGRFMEEEVAGSISDFIQGPSSGPIFLHLVKKDKQSVECFQKFI